MIKKALAVFAVLLTVSAQAQSRICANKTTGNILIRSTCYSTETAITNIASLKGPKGDTGLQGPRGLTGAQGTQGLKGDTGSQGIQGLKGDTGAPGSFSSCYQTTAEIVANYTDIEYNLSCYKDGIAGELVYHSELFPSFISAGYEFIPNVNANGKTTGGGWIVANERLESTGSLPTGLCCPFQ
jgi:hypothetical protein